MCVHVCDQTNNHANISLVSRLPHLTANNSNVTWANNLGAVTFIT